MASNTSIKPQYGDGQCTRTWHEYPNSVGVKAPPSLKISLEACYC